MSKKGKEKSKEEHKPIIEHPSTLLSNKVEEQEKIIQQLKIDVSILRDLLARTVRIMARQKNDVLKVLNKK